MFWIGLVVTGECTLLANAAIGLSCARTIGPTIVLDYCRSNSEFSSGSVLIFQKETRECEEQFDKRVFDPGNNLTISRSISVRRYIQDL